MAGLVRKSESCVVLVTFVGCKTGGLPYSLSNRLITYTALTMAGHQRLPKTAIEEEAIANTSRGSRYLTSGVDRRSNSMYTWGALARIESD